MNKDKVIHCRVTSDQHKAISEAATSQGVSITKMVVAALEATGLKLPR